MLSTDWAVRLDPAVWTWKRQTHRPRVLRPEALLHDRRPHPARDAELGDLLEQLRPGGEEEGEASGEGVDIEATSDRGIDIGDRVGQREGQLLGSRRPGLPHVIARDRDRVPLRELGGAELEDIGDEAHRRPRREDVGAPRDVLLEDVVLGRAADGGPRHALGLGRCHVEGQQDRRRGVDRHRRADLAERQAVEQDRHVGQAGDRHPDTADLALRLRRVGVVAHLGRQVEGDRQPGLPLREQVAETLVGLLGRREARVLAHRPEAAAVHRRLDASGEGVLPRAPEVAILVEVGGVGRGVEVPDHDPRRRLERVTPFRGGLERLRPQGLAPAIAGRVGPLPDRALRAGHARVTG